MNTHHKPHWGAITAGVLCAAGAIAILVDDIRVTHAVTIDHGLQILIVVLTIAIGHIAVQELRRGWHGVLTGLPLMAVALLASFWCVYQTAGRSAAVHERALSEQAEAARLRPAALERLQSNLDMLARERKALAAQCATGEGTKCKGIAKSIEVYVDAVNGSQIEVAKYAPKPVGASAHMLAAILAILPGVTATKEQIATWLLLFDPLVPSLLFEIGAMACFAVRGEAVTRTAAPVKLEGATVPPQGPSGLPLLAAPTGHDTPPPTRSEVQEREELAREFVASYTARHGHPPRHRELMAATGLPRSTASRYLAKAVG